VILFYEAGWFRKIAYNLKRLVINQPTVHEVLVEDEQHGLTGKDSTVDIDGEEGFEDIPKDVDVINEERRIKNMLAQGSDYSETFILDNLTKYYGKFMAVKGISFTLKKAECFGLLGVNGAGKTSTRHDSQLISRV